MRSGWRAITLLLVALLLPACDTGGSPPISTATPGSEQTAILPSATAIRSTQAQATPTLEIAATPTTLAVATETSLTQPTPSAVETAIPTPTLMPLSERRDLFEKVWQTVKDNYLYDDFLGVDWSKARTDYQERVNKAVSASEFYGAVGEMVGLLKDQHSRFIAPEQAKEEDDLNRGDTSYAGIGILSKQLGGSTMILLVFPGGPAEEAGLKRRDRILAIDGEKVVDTVGRIRGPVGTSVRLTVQSPEEEPRDVTLTRRSVTGKITASSSRLEMDGSIGYLLIPSLWANDMSEQVEAELGKLSDGTPLKGLIIDLRSNEGGWRTVLSGILGQLVMGDVGRFYSQGNDYPLKINVGAMYDRLKEVPVVVLVDGESQSYAEVLAASLQASGRAKVVGAKSAGNTETIYSYDFDDGSRLWIAQEGFKLPNGTNLEGRGVTPDLSLEIDWTQYSLKTDPHVLKAVEMLK